MEARRCLNQCFQWCSTACFECLQMIHITSWSCYSFRTQTKNRESRSAVEIQPLKKEEHDWTCSCSRKNNRILGCNETESSRTNIFTSLTIPLYLNNYSWWMILLHLRNLLIFLSRRIEITLNKNNVKITTNIYSENIPELGKNDVAIYYSSQTSH